MNPISRETQRDLACPGYLLAICIGEKVSYKDEQAREIAQVDNVVYLKFFHPPIVHVEGMFLEVKNLKFLNPKVVFPPNFFSEIINF